MKDEFNMAARGADAPGATAPPPTLAAGSIGIDIERYKPMFKDLDVSPEQMEQMILAMFTVLSSVVDLAFGVHPTQLACGKPAKALAESGKLDSDRGRIPAKAKPFDDENADRLPPEEPAGR